MDLRLDPADQALQAKARDFTEKHLFPYEDEVETTGELSTESLEKMKAATVEYGFNAINHSVEVGGQGMSVFQQMLVQEEMGKATNCLWAVPWHPANVLAYCNEEQIERYLKPSCDGTRRDAYAITEENAGSDPSMVASTAVRDGDDWLINGTKWHVTDGDLADFLEVHVHVDGDPDKATLFLIDKDSPGIELVRSPHYTHTSFFQHPIYSFTDVRVSDAQRLGEVGKGDALTKEWFVEERMMIGARTVGAATRCLDLSLAFAKERKQFGAPIMDFQSIEFMLADMAAEIMAAKAMLYRVGWQCSNGELSPKEIHAMASAVKLVCSEMAGRVADKAVQIFGGRGYMRENPVERLWREVRVDRIWEGTSEIQRLVIGNELRKRGSGAYTGWPS